MPIASLTTLANGARQFVVHDALEMTWWLSLSYWSKLTPSTTVASGSVAGAEMMTFFAPASRCLAASSRFVKNPVDSITTSMPRSPQGSAPGSRSASTLTSRPSTVSASSPTDTSPGKLPKTESYLSRWPRVCGSVMSLTATISTSASDSCAARKTLRPIRPKPLMPTRTAMTEPFPEVERRASGYRTHPGRRGRRTGGRTHRDSALQRQPVHVPVRDLDEQPGAFAEEGGQGLGDGRRAVPAAGAADRDHQVRLALGDVLGQQELEQRDHVRVELGEAPVAADVVDDPLVEPGERPQRRFVVGVGQEAHVERDVGVPRRAVLVAERGKRDGEPARRAGREQLVGHLAAQRRGGQAGGVDHQVGPLAHRREQLLLGPDAVPDAA